MKIKFRGEFFRQSEFTTVYFDETTDISKESSFLNNESFIKD